MHFTHVQNLPAVMASGHLKSDSLIRAESVNINECGNVQIKERRRNVAVSIPPGGVVADYVPFYFAPRSPMMFSISRGNVPTYTGGQGPLIYFWSHLAVVDQLDLQWVGSDGNCAHSLSAVTNDWIELESIVDWDVMTLKYWKDTPEDGDRMRRRMAELLVYRTFPLAAIAGIGAMSEEVAEVARSYTADRIPVQVRSDWYY
ncbi:MAG: DUF4433 domain-containing protein [Pseudonocardia sp.]|nr:DUF4433 domain-containing protein [Pseudonocardia sp.]